VRVHICGSLSVQADDLVVGESALPGRLGRRLWTYLVLHRRRPVGRSELVDALWGEESPEAADSSLNALVSRVRAALAPLGMERAELRTTSGSYALRLSPDVFVDRERAWTAITHVQAIRRTGNVREAWSEAVIAGEIASRGFLLGEDAPWIEAERRTLRDIELQALEAICDAELAQARAPEAERVARRLIAADQLRESGYRYLMRALAAGGNAAQAASVMEECRAALASVSAHPSDATERVFREIVH
jgi:SARP family transcriptional regulator, regulator of embCAB operon